MAMSMIPEVAYAEDMEETVSDNSIRAEYETCEPIEIVKDGEGDEDSYDLLFAPSETSVKIRTAEEIEDYFAAHPASLNQPITYKVDPVLSGSYSAGSLSDETLNSALNMVNRVRFIAGLDEVRLNSEYSDLSQTGALANYLNNQLSHYPTKPAGMSDDMYTKASKGCGSSNLAWSSNSEATLNHTIIRLWMGDSDSSNIAQLGHRRWVLDPRMEATGFGAVKGERGVYSGLYALDGAYRDSQINNIAWPARIMPTGFFSYDDAWSYSFGKVIDKDSVNVTLTRRNDGKVWKFPSSNSGNYFNVSNGGYGSTGCVIFRPSGLGLSDYGAGDIFDVKITCGSEEVNYSVSFFKTGSKYKINYVLGGTDDYPAENSPENPTEIRTTSDTVVLKPAKRLGYEFEGWYKDSAYKTKVTEIPTGTKANITLYAKWKKVPTKLSEGVWCSLVWNYYDDGVLDITDQKALSEDTVSWEKYSEKIREVRVNDTLNLKYSEGLILSKDGTRLIAVTPVGREDYIIVPESVTDALDKAFFDCSGVTICTYNDSVFEIVGSQGLLVLKIEKNKVITPVFKAYSDGTEALDTRISLDSEIEISTETGFSNIYYTVDGSLPAVPNQGADRQYEAPVAPTLLYTDRIRVKESDINKSTAVPGESLGTVTINAIAVRPDYKSSARISITYTVIDESTGWGSIKEEDRISFHDAKEVKDELWFVGITDSDYCAKAITFPDMRVYYHKTLLIPNKDYSVKYRNNVRAGEASIIITGKGNYSGTYEKKFNINQLSISGAENADFALLCNDRLQKGAPSIIYKLNGKRTKLKNNTDYKCEYIGTDNTKAEYDPNAFVSAGTYKIVVSGTGNFSGTLDVYETITKDKLISKTKVDKIQNVLYDEGKPVEPPIAVWMGKDPLVAGIDYEIVYHDNREIGTAWALISGKGEYFGTKKVTFNITGTDVKKLGIEYETVKEYTGAEIKPSIRVYEKATADNPEEKVLTEGTDYTVKYINNLSASNKAQIEIKGIGKYTGTIKKNFKVNAFELNSDDITVESVTNFKKGGAKPEVYVKAKLLSGVVTLAEGTDYSLSYKNNKVYPENSSLVPTVVIKGKGNYRGTIEKNFSIQKSSLNRMRITVNDIVFKEKSGICKPSVKLVDVDGKTLSAGKDYDKNIEYKYVANVYVGQKCADGTVKNVFRVAGLSVRKEDIIPAGTEIKAYVKALENGAYDGSAEAVFRFVKSDISKARITISPKIYIGKAVRPSKDDLNVYIGVTPLDKADYEIVDYTNNILKGTGKITIRGKGNYGGTKTAGFIIGPKLLFR